MVLLTWMADYLVLVMVQSRVDRKVQCSKMVDLMAVKEIERD